MDTTHEDDFDTLRDLMEAPPGHDSPGDAQPGDNLGHTVSAATGDSGLPWEDDENAPQADYGPQVRDIGPHFNADGQVPDKERQGDPGLQRALLHRHPAFVPDVAKPRSTRNAAQYQARALLNEGVRNYHVTRIRDPRGEMGTHRGVLHRDEYVDPTTLAQLLEEEMGCTLADAKAIYGRQGGGPLPARLRALRDRLDVLLAGADNLALLARTLGVPERNLQRAAKRGAAHGKPAPGRN